MTKTIIHNKEIPEAIRELVQESFSQLGAKLADILVAIEADNIASSDLRDIIAVNDALAIRFDQILAAHCRALLADCSNLEAPITRNVA